jgi:hypothetical protein
MRTFTFGLALITGLAIAQPLRAQVIPRYSAELSLGDGPRTTRSGETWYGGDSEPYLRGAFTVRLGSAGRIRPVVNADFSFGARGDQVLVCGLAPNGSCYQYFPPTDGLAAGVGVRAMLASRLTLGSSVGVARYDSNVRYVDADVALGLTRRIHALAHWRRLDWPESGGGRLWFQPLTFGVRLQ